MKKKYYHLIWNKIFSIRNLVYYYCWRGLDISELFQEIEHLTYTGLYSYHPLVLAPFLNTSVAKLWFETNRQGFAGPKTAACDAWHNPLSKTVLPTNIKISVLQKWSSGRLYSVTFLKNHLTDKSCKLFLYVSEKSIRQWVNGRV